MALKKKVFPCQHPPKIPTNVGQNTHFDSEAHFASNHRIIAAALCGLSTALIFQFYAVIYYGFGWFPSVLIVLALTAVISAPFWFFRVAQFMTYCTFADACSRIPRLLASSFVITLLLSGPVYRTTVMTESSQASMQCAQAAIREATRDATDQFYSALQRGVYNALSGWNDKIAWLSGSVRSVMDGKREIERAMANAKSTVRDAKDECSNALWRAKSDCERGVSGVSGAFGFISSDLRDKINQVCRVVDSGMCNVLSPVIDGLGAVDLDFLGFLNDFGGMLRLYIESKAKTNVAVGSDAMTAIYAQVNSSTEDLKELFTLVGDVIKYVTTAILVLTPLRNWVFLRRKKMPGKLQKRFSAILLYGNVILVTAGVGVAYLFDFSVGHSYNNFLTSMNDTSFQLKSDNNFEMQVSGGKVGKAIADLLLQAVRVEHEVRKDVGIRQCFPAMTETASTSEVLQVVGALLLLWVAALSDHYFVGVKTELKRLYKEEWGERHLAGGSAGTSTGPELGGMSVEVGAKQKIRKSDHQKPSKLPRVEVTNETLWRKMVSRFQKKSQDDQVDIGMDNRKVDVKQLKKQFEQGPVKLPGMHVKNAKR